MIEKASLPIREEREREVTKIGKGRCCEVIIEEECRKIVERTITNSRKEFGNEPESKS